MTHESSMRRGHEAGALETTRRSFLGKSFQLGAGAVLVAFGVRKSMEAFFSPDTKSIPDGMHVDFLSLDAPVKDDRMASREYSFATGELMPHYSVHVSFAESVERNAKPGELPETGWHPYETVQSLPSIAFTSADGVTTAFTLVTYCNGECRERGQIQRVHTADSEGKTPVPEMRSAILKRLLDDIETCLDDHRGVKLPSIDQLNPPPLLGSSIEFTSHLARQEDFEHLIRLWTDRLSTGQISQEDFDKLQLEESSREVQREAARARLAHALTFLRELLLKKEELLEQTIAMDGTSSPTVKDLAQGK